MATSAINIAMCFDDGYIFPSRVALYSLFRNNPHHKIDIYVIHAGLSSNNQQELHDLAGRFKNKRVIFKEIDDKEIREQFSKTLVLEYISIATYYRYVIADILPYIDKVLYIDGDVLFNGDITPIWQTSLDGYVYATVRDNWMMNSQKDHLRGIGFSKNDTFFIAGLLLMNLKQIRKENITKQLFDITSGDEYKDRLKFQDQDALNIVCRGKIKELPIKYHYISYDFYKDSHNFSGVISAHYAGAVKPWKNREVNSKLDVYFLQLYNDYMDGLARLVSKTDEFEWRDLYEDSVKQRHSILSLQYDLMVARSTRGAIRNILTNVKVKIVRR